MITWKDFILDDKIGPSLSLPEDGAIRASGATVANDKQSRWTQTGGPSVMDDAKGLAIDVTIQETGQEIKPARMVGFSGLESHSIADDRFGMEADSAASGTGPRLREGTG